MHEYIERLINCGYPPCTAYSICHDIRKTMGECELETYISIIESVAYGVPHVE